jgi:AMMECR1 domain-containing protein
MSCKIFPSPKAYFHAKTQSSLRKSKTDFLCVFAPLRDQYLLCLSLIAAATFLIFSASQASPDFTKSEKQALLEYARSCMAAQLSDSPAPTPPEFATRQQRACFVTFFTGKRVFACFGGFSPRRATLAEEINENVRLALKNDARSRLITKETVARAGIQISFPIGQPERVKSYQNIDPAREGMFVENASNGVAFVPGEARTANWAFCEALRRLGERDAAGVTVYRFKADAVSTRNLSQEPTNR